MRFILRSVISFFICTLCCTSVIYAHTPIELTFSRGNSVSTENMVIRALPDRSFVIGGSVFACRTPAVHRLFPDGTLQSFSALVGNGYIQSVLPLKDSTYIVSGKFDEFVSNAGFTNLIRIDGQGVVTWDLKYSDANTTPPSVDFTHGFNNLVQTDDGSIYATVANNALIKLHLDGAEAWAGLIDSAGMIYGMVDNGTDLLILSDKGIIRSDSAGSYNIINKNVTGKEFFKLSKDSFAVLGDDSLTIIDANTHVLGSYVATTGQVLTHGCYANGAYYLSYIEHGKPGVIKMGTALSQIWKVSLNYNITINSIAANDITIAIAGTENEPANNYALTRAHHGFVKCLALGDGSGIAPIADIGITGLKIDSVGEIPDHSTFGDFAMITASVTVKNYGSEAIDSFYLDWQAPLDSVNLTDSCNMTSHKYTAHLNQGDSITVKYPDISFLHVHNVDFMLGMVMNTASPNGRLDANTANDIFQKQYVIHSGLKEKLFNDAAIELYPNPATDQLHLHSAKPMQARLDIVDAMGKTVYSKQLINEANATIDISAYTKGIYFVRLHNATQQQTMEIVKN
jgi:hypothetical protein